MLNPDLQNPAFAPDYELPDSRLRVHTPNSYQLNKDLEHFRRGELTEEGLKKQLVTFLKERAMLALDEFEIKLYNNKLYSDDFPGIALTDLYATVSADPIYNLRAPYDTKYISQVEAWANSTAEPFNWIRFSPTTGAMSRETKIELGRREDNDLHIIILTVPFRQEQDLETAFIEIRELSSIFNPDFFHARNELDLLGKPILLDNHRLREEFSQDGEIKRDLVIRYLDQQLSRISDKKYYMLQPEQSFSLARQQNFLSAIAMLDELDLFNEFTAMMADPDADAQLQIYFNNLVNQFDKAFAALNNNKPHLLTKTPQFDGNIPELIISGCGGFGRVATDIISSGIKLPERAVPASTSYPPDFGDPHFGVCGGGRLNSNGMPAGCEAYTIVGGCELCVSCHHRYSSN